MHTITLDSSAQLPEKYAQYVGKTFPFFDRLKMGGTGSIRMIYLKGLNTFDEMTDLSTSLQYVSMELRQQGFVIRYSKKNIYKACLVKYNELENISIVSQKIRIYYKGRPKIIHEAVIVFKLKDISFCLGLLPIFYKAGIAFFRKQPLRKHCHFEMKEYIKELQNDNSWLETLAENMI